MTIAIALTLIVLVLGTATAFMLPAFFKAKEVAKAWVPLPLYPKVFVVLPKGHPEVTPARVAMKLSEALASLADYGPWSKQQLIEGLPRVSLIINDTNEWLDTSGQKVGGQTLLSTCALDLSMTSMLHELGHAFEFILDGRIDEKHVNWGPRGLWKADEDYHRKAV